MATVLIVDDLPSEAQLMAGVVSSLGHASVHANDGENAIASAKSAKPQLILLDVVMPGANGFETCRKLKKDPETANIPIIMVTTKDQDSDKFWASRQGANDYVVKPFTPDSLAAVIKKHLT
jgi:twitching motility two-component system response regulator PilH